MAVCVSGPDRTAATSDAAAVVRVDGVAVAPVRSDPPASAETLSNRDGGTSSTATTRVFSGATNGAAVAGPVAGSADGAVGGGTAVASIADGGAGVGVGGCIGRGARSIRRSGGRGR